MNEEEFWRKLRLRGIHVSRRGKNKAFFVTTQGVEIWEYNENYTTRFARKFPSIARKAWADMYNELSRRVMMVEQGHKFFKDDWKDKR